MTAFCSSGNGAGSDSEPPPSKVNRQPYAAGKFYSGDSSELSRELKELYEAAIAKEYQNVFSVVVPHAGYVYSGVVAASAYNQIDYSKKYDHVFILASSHRDFFDGASVYNIGDYMTPLGTVKVDTSLANKLIEDNSVFKYSPRSHEQEHSLEVQLPFLQYKMGRQINLVPIIIGTDGPETCMKIAKALKPYLTENNLFVVSTDFSHYPSYADAVVNDKKTADAIVSNDAGVLLKTLSAIENSRVSGLATSLCGYTSVLSMMYMTEKVPGVKVHQLQYKNSGDSPYGEKNRVVGYNAIVFEGQLSQQAKDDQDVFSESDKKDLLKIARKTLEEYLKTGEVEAVDENKLTEPQKMQMGAFVTLKKDGRLRGCIGRFTADESLYKIIQQMAIAAATEDSRFSKVTYDELAKLDIEISLLTPLKKITSPDEIVLGKHGIYIRKGYRTGTFLPQVATETGWNKEEFLGHCAEDKAGIGWDGWKDAELFTYEAIIFGE
jgi:AmmeMemoRadiSam system protein B/AmmeMemoRadiSam system protein A